MNFKNVAENLAIALIGVVFGAVLTFFTITQSNKALSNQLTPIIKQAIEKETTAITNEFITEIKKLKSKNGGTVELVITPEIENQAQTIKNDNTKPQKTKVQTNIAKDTLQQKEGFFKRLFGKKNKDQNP